MNMDVTMTMTLTNPNPNPNPNPMCRRIEERDHAVEQDEYLSETPIPVLQRRRRSLDSGTRKIVKCKAKI